MGIFWNFPLVPLCLSKPDKATLCTAHRFLHCCCVLRSEDKYSRARTADAGGIFQPKSFFPLKNKTAFIEDFSEGVADLSSRKKDDVNI